MEVRKKTLKTLFSSIWMQKKAAVSPDIYILKLADLFGFCNRDFEKFMLLREGV